MDKFYNNIYRTQVKVGIFTVTILLILIFGYLWLSGRISMRQQQDLRLSFDDVIGLEVGDKAMFRGMEVGRIKDIEAREGDILVTARIRKDIRLREGARFMITDSSLMGGTALNIGQGDGEGFLDLSKVQTGAEPFGIMSILAKATGTIDEFNRALAEIRGEEGLIGKSSDLLDDAGAAARSVDDLALSSKAEIAATLEKIERLTGQVNRMVDDNSGNLTKAMSKAPATLANLDAALDSLQTLSSRLGSTIEGVNSGKGTAGKLLTDAELYDRLLQSVENLDALVADIRANPKKYVKFSLF